MTLQTLEEQFKNYVFDNDPAIYPAIESRDHLRLRIYQEGYALRLVDILSREYPGLGHQMGEAAFARACRDYLHAHPSVYTSVHEIGASFQDWILERYPEKTAWHELVQFEWALVRAQRMTDTPRLLQLDDLQALPPESWAELTCGVHPAVRVLLQTHNILDVWRATVFPQDYATIPALRALKTPQWVLVGYKHPEAFYHPIDSQTHELLKAVMSGKNFGECAEWMSHTYAMDDDSVAAALVQQWVQWIQQGILKSEP